LKFQTASSSAFAAFEAARKINAAQMRLKGIRRVRRKFGRKNIHVLLLMRFWTQIVPIEKAGESFVKRLVRLVEKLGQALRTAKAFSVSSGTI
jgi:hypothetical protein